MGFGKGSVIGFGVGFAAAVVVSFIPIRRPGFLIEVETKQKIDRKEAFVRINDLAEEVAMLRAFISVEDENNAEEFGCYFASLRMRALTDPFYQKLLRRLSEAQE